MVFVKPNVFKNESVDIIIMMMVVVVVVIIMMMTMMIRMHFF